MEKIKKIILAVALSAVCMSGSAQESIDYFDFVKSFDWEMSDTEFVQRFLNGILGGGDTRMVSGQSSQFFLLDDIKFGDLDGEAYINFSSTGKKTIGFLIREAASNAEELDALIREITKAKIGAPDAVYDNVALDSVPVVGDVEGLEGQICHWICEETVYSSVTNCSNGGYTCTFAAVKENRDPDFRLGRWGEGTSAIMKKEGKADRFGLEGSYTFEDSFAGVPCLVAYRFTDGKLTSGKYIFRQNTPENCISRYYAVVSELTKLYGVPHMSEKSAASESQRRRLGDGKMIAKGMLQYDAYWQKGYDYVTVTMHKSDAGVELSAQFNNIFRTAESK